MPLSGRTTVLVWRPVAECWRGGEGGTAGAVLAAVAAALAGPGYRAVIPSPEPDEVEGLARAGDVLNEAVRQRYARGGGAGAVAAAAAGVERAARAVGAGVVSRPGERVLCVGRCDRLVHVRVDPRLHAVWREAAAVHGMSLGAWVRDAVAASVGEHQARRPAVETRHGRTVAGRVAGLLAQAAAVAADAGESAAVGAAEDAAAAAVERMSRWGSRR